MISLEEKKFLDLDGLRQLWSRITTLFATKDEIPDVTWIEESIGDLDEIRAGAKLGSTSIQDISGKQDVIEDIETIRAGAEKGATALQADALNGIATENYVDTKVSELVDSAPETLNTLKELSDALGGDQNFAATVSEQIGKKQDAISDLDAIRRGAALGATSIQEHQDISGKANIGDSYTKTESDSKYLTEHQSLADYALKTDLSVVDELSDTVSNAIATINEAKEDAYTALSNVSSMSEDVSKAVADTNEIVRKANEGEFDGKPGKDGVSVSHAWSGSRLILTSASGTTAVNLKGDTGADGKDWIPTENELNEIAQKASNNLLPQITSINSALLNKQDVITDLNDIRRGAALGETSIQEHQDISGKANVGDSYSKTESDAKYLTEHQSLSGKQDVISDLDEIRAGAALGKTAIQEHQSLEAYALKTDLKDVSVEGKQDTIEDLDAIRAGAALGMTSLQEHQDISGKANVGDSYTKAESDELFSKGVNLDKVVVVNEPATEQTKIRIDENVTEIEIATTDDLNKIKETVDLLKEDTALLTAEIESMSETKTADVKLNMTSSNIHFTKRGNIVMCAYTDTTIANISAGDLGTVGTIPDGFRPALNFAFTPFFINDAVPKIQLSFNSNGNISAYNYSSAQNATRPYRFMVTYLAK